MITIVSPSRYKIEKRILRKKIEAMLAGAGLDTKTDLNLVFVGKRKMREIASQYKKEDVALPVLSFPYKDEETLLGEIFICYPQVILLAAEREKKVDDMILKMVEHGFENLLK